MKSKKTFWFSLVLIILAAPNFSNGQNINVPIDTTYSTGKFFLIRVDTIYSSGQIIDVRFDTVFTNRDCVVVAFDPTTHILPDTCCVQIDSLSNRMESIEAKLDTLLNRFNYLKISGKNESDNCIIPNWL